MDFNVNDCSVQCPCYDVGDLVGNTTTRFGTDEANLKKEEVSPVKKTRQEKNVPEEFKKQLW
jgi:hypothetical protein